MQQLATWCRLPVRAVKDGDAPMAGFVHVAVSNDHLELGADRLLRYTATPRHSPFRPSIDVLFTSAAAHGARPGVGVLLTGMGRDGAKGLLAIRDAGGRTLGQNEASCVVYGMPKAAFETGAVERQLPLERIAPELLKLTNRLGER